MRIRPIELVVGAWPEQAAAERAMHELRVRRTAGIVGALAVVVTVDGELLVAETQGRAGTVGAALDAGLGLLTAGVGWLPLDGAAVVRAAEARDCGIGDAELRALGERVARRSSVLLLVVDGAEAATVGSELRARNGDTTATEIGPGLLDWWTPAARSVAGRPTGGAAPVAIRTSAVVMRAADDVMAG